MVNFVGVKVAQDHANSTQLVIYPCRDYTLLNVVALFKDPEKDPNIDTAQRFPPDEMLARFSAYHPNFRKLLEYPQTVQIWPLRECPPLDTWVKGNACVAGDAAHPMMPYAAQGGAMCIEDAGTLGVLLPLGTKPEEVNARLRLFESARKERCEMFQYISHQTAVGGDTFKLRTGTRDFVRIAYDYDAIAVAEAALSDFGAK